MYPTITFRSVTGQEFTTGIENATIVMLPEYVTAKVPGQFDAICIKGVGQIGVSSETALAIKLYKQRVCSEEDTGEYFEMSYTEEQLQQQHDEFVSKLRPSVEPTQLREVPNEEA